MQDALFALADAVETRLSEVQEKLEYPHRTNLDECKALLHDAIEQMTALAHLCQSSRFELADPVAERLRGLRENLRAVFVLLNHGEHLFGSVHTGYDSSGKAHLIVARASGWKA